MKNKGTDKIHTPSLIAANKKNMEAAREYATMIGERDAEIIKLKNNEEKVKITHNTTCLICNKKSFYVMCDACVKRYKDRIRGFPMENCCPDCGKELTYEVDSCTYVCPECQCYFSEQIMEARDRAIRDCQIIAHREVEIRDSVINNMCENEEEARTIASKVLGKYEAFGDSYGVPTIQDVVEQLIKKIKAKKWKV